MNEIYDILKKRFVYISEVEEAINKSKDVWHEEKGFLKTVKGRLTVYLKQLQTQLGKNPLLAIENKDHFASVIERDYKEGKIANKIRELKFPTNLGFFDRINVGVASWGGAGNINDYARLSKYYGDQIRKLFGEKYYRMIDKKEGIRNLMWLPEEYKYLGDKTYTDRYGKEQMGMLFKALQGEREPTWKDFLDMVRSLRSEEHEITKLFGDRKTVGILIDCKKRYHESPTDWIRTLSWILRIDLPKRSSEIIEKAKREWLEAVEEIKKVIYAELRKDTGKYRKVLREGVKEWDKYWENGKRSVEELDLILASMVRDLSKARAEFLEMEGRIAKEAPILVVGIRRRREILNRLKVYGEYINRDEPLAGKERYIEAFTTHGLALIDDPAMAMIVKLGEGIESRFNRNQKALLRMSRGYTSFQHRLFRRVLEIEKTLNGGEFRRRVEVPRYGVMPPRYERPPTPEELGRIAPKRTGAPIFR